VYGAEGTGTTVTTDTAGTRTVHDGAAAFALPVLDFNRLSFRSNGVLRWEWLPGSTAYFIWQQSRTGVGTPGQLINPQDLLDATRAPGDNVFAVKVSYWIGVQ
jgi:hypothetical protein